MANNQIIPAGKALTADLFTSSVIYSLEFRRAWKKIVDERNSNSSSNLKK